MDTIREVPPREESRTPSSDDKRTHLKHYVLSFLVILGIAGALYYLDEGRSASASFTSVNVAEGSGPAPRIGEPAPDFVATGIDGKTFRLSDFRGKPVWVNFWASWCPPCRAETPDVEAVYEEKKGQGLVLLALSLGEEPSPVKNYVQTAGITFTVGLDTSTEIAGLYRINGLPTHFFIDRNGIIRDMQVGGLSRASALKKLAEIMP